MNKIFLSILLCFLSYQVFPLTIFPDAFYGSALCDTLSTTYQIPKNYQGKYYYKVEILKSDTSNYIELIYHLQSGETDTLKQVTTDLKKYFLTSTLPSASGDLKWTVGHKVYIDGVLQASDLTINWGWPYKPCYTSKSDCKAVFIYRKKLVDICPAFDVYTTPYVKIFDDSILVNFKDENKQRNIVCKALGTMLVTDSVVLNNLPPRDFTIFHADTQIVYCVKAPCPPMTALEIVGKANLQNCAAVPYESVFEGSVLCKNLSVNLLLPEKLQGNYTYTHNAEFVKNTLIIDYYLNQNRAEVLKEINIPVNDILPLENLTQNFNLANIQVIQNIHLNGSLYVLQGYGQPAARCFEYKADCDKITVYRRSLQAICSGSRTYTKYAYKIEDESVYATFSDSIVLSNIACMAIGNYIKRDSIEITNLKKSQYELLVNEKRNYNPQIFTDRDNHSWSSTVELSNCITTGINDAEAENNSPWPNPCTSELHLKDYQGKVTFTNQLGQNFVLDGDVVFNVTNLPRGIYMISYGQGGHIKMEKVILK